MRCPGWPCDTPFAIEPSLYRKDSRRLEVEEVVEEINGYNVENICLTGGEPFLQKEGDLEHLVAILNKTGRRVECFSNGSFQYPDWAIKNIHFMMDWKLTGSGEAQTARETRIWNAMALKASDGIKFVVTGKEDLQEANEVSAELNNLGVKAQYWVGAAWGHISDTEIVDYILEHQPNWKLNVQVHKHIWPADERGV